MGRDTVDYRAVGLRAIDEPARDGAPEIEPAAVATSGDEPIVCEPDRFLRKSLFVDAAGVRGERQCECERTRVFTQAGAVPGALEALEAPIECMHGYVHWGRRD